MKYNKITTTPGGQPPADKYDDGNIPAVDLPQSSSKNTAQSSAKNSTSKNGVPHSGSTKDIIPDEVPRKDGPGGEA